MTIDQASQDIRALFDWTQAAQAAPATPDSVANDDLELALRLLACNPRDRRQFQTGVGPARQP